MATLALAGTRASLCRSCLRRTFGFQFQQVRGKKRLKTVKVRLLDDIELFGPKGSVLEVAKGRMRNIWHPQNRAQYITREMELKTGVVGVVARDPNFDPKREMVEKERIRERAEILASTVAPSRVMQLLEQLLPKSLHFYRATTTPHLKTLVGPVTKAEIVTALKTIAAAKSPDEGSKITLKADDITVAGVKGDKVTYMGDYDLKIQLKDVPNIVKRKLLVTREDDDDAVAAPKNKPPATTATTTTTLTEAIPTPAAPG